MILAENLNQWFPWTVEVVSIGLVGVGVLIALAQKNRELRRSKAEVDLELSRRVAIEEAVGVSEKALEATEEALRASDRQHRLFVENAPDPIFTVDRSGMIEDVNDAFLREGSFLRHEIIGTDFGARVHPDDSRIIPTVMQTVLNGGSFRYEVRVNDSQGVYRWNSIVSWPLYGEHNEVVGLQGMIRNVDRRRKDEIQLRQLSAAIEQSPVSVVITDIEGAIQYVNPACAKTTGYSPEEILGQNPRILKTGSLEDSFYKELWVTITAGKVWRGDFHNKTKSGEEYWERAVIAPVLDEQGDIAHFVAVKENLTELRETERALRDSVELFHTLIDTAEDSIFVKDRDLRYLLVNPAMAKDLERTPEAIRGLTDLDLFGKEEGQEIRAIDLRVLNGESVEVVSSSTVTGERRAFAVSRVPLRDQDGEIIGVCGIARDITEREKQKEDLKQAKNAAEAATVAKTLFTANISHELRTPLNGVVGMIDLLKQTDLDPEQRRYVGIADSSAQSLTELIGDVLDFSRIEAGKVELTTTTFELRPWLAETVEIVLERARAKELKLEWYVGPEMPETICGDQYRLRQILLNLIWNAVKFTEEGGISVSVGFVSGGSNKGALEFSVQDTGIGIPESRVESIFEVFTLGDESRTRSFGGTGLGLAISRNLVEKMGGRIWVESSLGAGSTFRFTLPQTPGGYGGHGMAEEVVVSVEISRTLRVLVVDDNPVNRLVAVATVGKCGHKIAEAEDGHEALEMLARDEVFDVVLMDLQMPRLDGLGATREIRKGEAENQHLWIIGLTAAATVEDKEACLAAGMDDYLSKPVRFDDLKEALDRAVTLDSTKHGNGKL